MKTRRTDVRRRSDRSTTQVDAEIGVRLKARRLALGLPQPHVASCVGVTFQQLQKYEMGLNRVSAARLVQLAEVLETDPVALLPSAPEPDQERLRANRTDPMLRQLRDVFVRVSPRGQRMILELARTLAREHEAKRDCND